jgi:hypothetical protein
MSNHHPTRMSTVRLELTWQQTRGARGNQYICRRRGIDLGVQGGFKFYPLWGAFLNELRSKSYLFQGIAES